MLDALKLKGKVSHPQNSVNRGWLTTGTNEGVIMGLLFRFFRFLFLLAFRIAIRLAVVLFHLLMPVVLRLLHLMWVLVAASFTAAVTGPRQYIDRLGADWTRQLIVSGLDRDRIDDIYILCRLAVAARMVLGWVIAVLFTVLILRVVFGIHF